MVKTAMAKSFFDEANMSLLSVGAGVESSLWVGGSVSVYPSGSESPPPFFLENNDCLS